MPPSQFQAAHPLSPRKFWKKMFEKVFTWLVVLLIIAPSVVVAYLALGNRGLGLAGIITLGIASAIGFWILCILLYAWYVSEYIRRYYYDANDNFVTIKKGVFAPTEIHVQYAKIQDVYVDQDILDRVMGLYDVHLASATVASGIEAHVDGVEKGAAEGIKDFLLAKVSGQGPATPSAPGAAAPLPTTPSSAAHFDHEVSSRTYPIVDSWVAMRAVTSVFSALMWTVFVFIIVFMPGKHSDKSLFDLLGLQGSTVMMWAFGVFVAVYIASMLYTILWRATYFFAFEPDYILMRQGIIAKNENHLPYRAVQDVTVSQGIIERIFGLATVRIENAAAAVMVGKRLVTSAIRIPGQPLAKANELSGVVKGIALTKDASRTGL